jgi:hypothetical protein
LNSCSVVSSGLFLSYFHTSSKLTFRVFVYIPCRAEGLEVEHDAVGYTSQVKLLITNNAICIVQRATAQSCALIIMSGILFWVNRFFSSMLLLTAPLKASIPVLSVMCAFRRCL